MSSMHVQNSSAMKANEEFCIDGLYGQVVMMYTTNADPKIKVVYMTAVETLGWSMPDEDYLVAKLKFIKEDDLKRTIVEVQIDIDSAVFIFTPLGFGTRLLEGSDLSLDASDLPRTFTDVWFIDPFEDPKNLSYAFFGYPDLKDTCTYCVLKYSYDSSKYDSLVIYSKNTKRLNRIGLTDTYSTSITDTNGCKIEYVFSIKQDICGIVSKWPGPIEIKIWARIPADYINTLGPDDSSICRYLREVYEEHFKIGLQKSNDASMSKETQEDQSTPDKSTEDNQKIEESKDSHGPIKKIIGVAEMNGTLVPVIFHKTGEMDYKPSKECSTIEVMTKEFFKTDRKNRIFEKD